MEQALLQFFRISPNAPFEWLPSIAIIGPRVIRYSCISCSLHNSIKLREQVRTGLETTLSLSSILPSLGLYPSRTQGTFSSFLQGNLAVCEAVFLEENLPREDTDSLLNLHKGTRGGPVQISSVAPLYKDYFFHFILLQIPPKCPIFLIVSC